MSVEKPRRKKRKVMGAASSSSSSNKGPPGLIPVSAVPLEIIEEIFHNLPYGQVIRHCGVVCKQWKEVADSESLWRERCRREGLVPRDVARCDWRKFYVLSKKRRNLLKNPIAEEEFKFWQIVSNGGNLWKIEDPMTPHPNENVRKNFVTSYSMCLKSQEINLKTEGYNALLMDKFQPAIKVSDWYSARWDCACEYKIKVELLNEKKKCIQTFEPEAVYLEQWNDQQWHQMTHVFTDYGPGVRFVRFVHGGQDRQFWAGWYGVRVTDSCVEVCPDN
ncbi:unnamed protein product [Knipowitschia caucasica]|uniref:F-box only protein 6-like n=1 Tax=Knipowitschia caucasica TaxID=637954 RepID=A0AAV2M017_KNICA